jgi:uncharacterized protein YfaT (DUF1175 family)
LTKLKTGHIIRPAWRLPRSKLQEAYLNVLRFLSPERDAVPVAPGTKLSIALTISLTVAALLCAACGGSSEASQAISEGSGSDKHSAEPAPANAAAPVETRNEISEPDSDSDGLPDRGELRSFDDRRNFRRWMSAIAEMQFYRLSPEWNSEQRDCSGLVRFCMREALRTHDRAWFKRIGAEYELIAPDVRGRILAEGALGEKLFRTDYGVFKKGDVAGNKFSEFADARTLKNYNSVFVSRNRRDAEAGDLLFFHEPANPRYPYHVMILIAEARHAGEGAADWVVYHTGSSPSDSGTVKKVRLAVLDQHPSKRWRPVENNPNFLGFYRLKMLD